MLATLLILGSALGGVPGALAAADGPASAEVVRTLQRWRKAYVAGRIDLDRDAVDDGKARRVYSVDLLPKPRPKRFTHEAALRRLLARATDAPSIEATREVVLLASLGFGDVELSPRRQPMRVRELAMSALLRIQQPASLLFLAKTAAGDRAAWPRHFDTSVQAAAVMALGGADRVVFRSIVEKQLGHRAVEVRWAASEALRAQNVSRSLDAVRLALGEEQEAVVARSLVLTATSVLEDHHEAVDAKTVRECVQEAVRLLGRTDWRTDLAITELLEKFRSPMAVPALIDVLQRFVDKAGQVASGRLSTLLLHRAHEVLQSLTGTRLPANRPDQWKAFWEREKDGFVLAKPVDDVAPNGTVARGFFGIPVQGSRVVFVIDISGSMQTPHPTRTGTSATPAPTRYEVAAQELERAVDALPPDARFNVVLFSDGVQVWRKGFVAPTDERKTALHRMLRGTGPNGGTNLFGGLEKAFELESTLAGSRYRTPADEVFLLSDGEPSAGEIIEPGSILTVIRELNLVSQARVHTVFMGSGHSSFMQTLAKNNGGKYVRL